MEHRRFQIDTDIAEVKDIKYNAYLMSLLGCISTTDCRQVGLNTTNFKNWNIDTYYNGVRLVSPILEIKDDYPLIEQIYTKFDKDLAVHTSFGFRRTTYCVEAFDLKKWQTINLAKLFFASLDVFYKINNEKRLQVAFDINLSNLDPETLRVEETWLYQLFEEYHLLSFYRYADKGMVGFTIARSTFKTGVVLNWLKLFTHMVEWCKNTPESMEFPKFSTAKELVLQLGIDTPLRDWMRLQCAE